MPQGNGALSSSWLVSPHFLSFIPLNGWGCHMVSLLLPRPPVASLKRLPSGGGNATGGGVVGLSRPQVWLQAPDPPSHLSLSLAHHHFRSLVCRAAPSQTATENGKRASSSSACSSCGTTSASDLRYQYRHLYRGPRQILFSSPPHHSWQSQSAAACVPRRQAGTGTGPGKTGSIVTDSPVRHSRASSAWVGNERLKCRSWLGASSAYRDSATTCRC